jgi:fatty acid desaturase
MTHTGAISSEAALGISMSRARALVEDLRRPRPWIYWADFLTSVTIGYAAFLFFPEHDAWSLAAGTCVVVSALALYRAVLFVHELVHAAAQLPYFTTVWHALCGVPLLTPKFVYEFHQEHHGARTYGTALDGEYVNYADQPTWRILLTPFSAFGGLPVFTLRFLLLAPVSWIYPPIRPFVLTRASALAIDAEFHRKLPPGPVPRRWIIQEAACFLYCLVVAVLVVTGHISLTRLAEAYAVVTLLLFVNWMRVLVAHRYESGNQRMTFSGQVLDSVDHTGFPLLTELWAPLGLRDHAIHHFFPWLPYHALPEARRRLHAAVPPDGGYWWTADRSMWATLTRLLYSHRQEQEKIT